MLIKSLITTSLSIFICLGFSANSATKRVFSRGELIVIPGQPGHYMVLDSDKKFRPAEWITASNGWVITAETFEEYWKKKTNTVAKAASSSVASEAPRGKAKYAANSSRSYDAGTTSLVTYKSSKPAVCIGSSCKASRTKVRLVIPCGMRYSTATRIVADLLKTNTQLTQENFDRAWGRSTTSSPECKTGQCPSDITVKCGDAAKACSVIAALEEQGSVPTQESVDQGLEKASEKAREHARSLAKAARGNQVAALTALSELMSSNNNDYSIVEAFNEQFEIDNPDLPKLPAAAYFQPAPSRITSTFEESSSKKKHQKNK